MLGKTVWLSVMWPQSSQWVWSCEVKEKKIPANIILRTVHYAVLNSPTKLRELPVMTPTGLKYVTTEIGYFMLFSYNYKISKSILYIELDNDDMESSKCRSIFYNVHVLLFYILKCFAKPCVIRNLLIAKVYIYW